MIAVSAKQDLNSTEHLEIFLFHPYFGTLTFLKVFGLK